MEEEFLGRENGAYKNVHEDQGVSRGDSSYLELIAIDKKDWIFSKFMNKSQELVIRASK